MMGISTKDEKSIDADLTVEDERVDTTPTAAAESIDSRDLDRAFVYLARHNQNHLDDNVVDLKALRRKIDWRIIPVMTACYGLQFLDKVLINVSQALQAFKTTTANCVLNNSIQALWEYGKTFTLLEMIFQMHLLYSI